MPDIETMTTDEILTYVANVRSDHFAAMYFNRTNKPGEFGKPQFKIKGDYWILGGALSNMANWMNSQCIRAMNFKPDQKPDDGN